MPVHVVSRDMAIKSFSEYLSIDKEFNLTIIECVPTLTPFEFLSAVWPRQLLTKETLELRAINRSDGSKKRDFACSIEEFLEKANHLRDYDVYFGVSTRIGTNGGKKTDCYRLKTVWVDFDGMSMKQLKGLDPKPDIMVDSGGGVHAYWILDHPVLARERYKELEAVNRGLSLRFNGDDQAIDISRILRVPGFFNYKYKPARLVKAYAI